MKLIQHHLSRRQAEFAAHPFFSYLRPEAPLQHVMAFSPALTFWVMAFQDVLRLNERLVTDPVLAKMAHHHRREDSGHERWFLEDVANFDGGLVDVQHLFGPSHTSTRDAAYALVSETFRATSDEARITLLLALESTGHIFFDRIARYVHAHPASFRLRYFSDHHLKVEKAHSLFEIEMERALWEREVSDAERANVIALIDRVFAAFTEMFDGLASTLAQRGLLAA